jgi:predicted adenine nucleotide alpha hydrolase (AANH) superfamily ATPase
MAGACTLRNRILRCFDLKFEVVKRILKAQDWISYTTDVWTSPWKVSYLGITAHWIDCDWKKKDVLIAFSPIL